jgi:hypothetical protein
MMTGLNSGAENQERQVNPSATETGQLESIIRNPHRKYKHITLKIKLWRRLGRERQRRYSSYLFSTSALDGVSGQRHAPAVLYHRGKDPQYSLDRRLGGPQSWSGRRG